MAQGTGQARRRQAGKDKASEKNAAARTRGSRASAKASKASASKSKPRTSAAASKSRSSRSSSARAGSSRAKTPARRRSGSANSKAAGSIAQAAQSTVQAAQSTAQQTSDAVSSIAHQTGHAVTATAQQTGRTVTGVAQEVARKAAAARHLVRPLGATGAAVAIAGLAGAAARKGQQRSSRGGGFLSKLDTPRLRKAFKPTPLRKARKTLGQRATSRFSQARSQARESLPDVTDLLPRRQEFFWAAAIQLGLRAGPIIRRARLPIQLSIDIAVPVEVAYDEWMKLDFLPEGSRGVEKIERGRDGVLTGRRKGLLHSPRWEAEIRDERDCESFAWRSVRGSDCAGLITFHPLGDRLTRLELQLDLVPSGPVEALDAALRLADVRARNELRRFKARLETINPDVYDHAEESEPEGQDE